MSKNVLFLNIYRQRARFWLNLSSKDDRKAALAEAVTRLNTTIHHTSKLAPAFYNDQADDKSASEIAAILKGVAILFRRGGHAAFSELASSLQTELVALKFRHRITWKRALDRWEDKYGSQMESIKANYEEEREDRYDRYDHYDRYDRYDRW